MPENRSFIINGVENVKTRVNELFWGEIQTHSQNGNIVEIAKKQQKIAKNGVSPG